MATVFLNGHFVGVGEAQVSAFDAGLQHGVGLFETMTAVADASGGSRPRVVALWEHVERLKTSAIELGLVSTLHADALAEAVERTVAKEAQASKDTERFRVRLTVTGGDMNMLGRRTSGGASGHAPGERGGERTSQDTHEPTLMIHAQPATVYPEEMFEQGVRATIADLRVNPLDPMQGHKTLNYWARLRQLQLASGRGAAEALVFQVTNHLAGGCVSNAFLVKDGALISPIARGEEVEVGGGSGGGSDQDDPDRERQNLAQGQMPLRAGVLPSPVLPGVVRRWVMDWASGADVPVVRRMLTIDDVLGADEVFLTNSSWGVLPVVGVERERIGRGNVGAVTQRLVGAWAAMMSPGEAL
ncbi:MAG: aminotransferase class IV [Planctomycetota bacterium]